jgi:GLPGLI family protein
MKTKISILLICFSLQTVAQNYKVTYLAKGVQELKKDSTASIILENAVLLIKNSSESIFFSSLFEKTDHFYKSIIEIDKEGKSIDPYEHLDSLNKISYPSFLEDEFIWKLDNTGTYQTWTTLGVEAFQYKQQNRYNWVLGSETKEILGYRCLQASTELHGRAFTAWYTEDIPIRSGPHKFSGLPGLIMQVESGDKLFRFEAIAFEKMTSFKEIIPRFAKEARPISFDDFLKIRSDYYHDPLKQFENQGFTVQLSPEFSRKLDSQRTYIFIEESE